VHYIKRWAIILQLLPENGQNGNELNPQLPYSDSGPDLKPRSRRNCVLGVLRWCSRHTLLAIIVFRALTSQGELRRQEETTTTE